MKCKIVKKNKKNTRVNFKWWVEKKHHNISSIYLKGSHVYLIGIENM